MLRNRPLLVLTVLFLVRFAVNFIHGEAHDDLSVPLAAWQQAFVWLTIVIGPLVTMVWLWIRPAAPVAWALAAFVTAGWLFGLYFHFGPMNPDHVSAQPHMAGHDSFILTAAALAIVEPLVAVAAVWLARSLAKSRSVQHA